MKRIAKAVGLAFGLTILCASLSVSVLGVQQASASSTAKDVTVRAAAILTDAGVGTTAVNIFNVPDEFITYQITFTLGSLTDVVITPQLSWDNTNWFDVKNSPGPVTLSATGKAAITVNCKGAHYSRLSLLGEGTVTSSSATVVAHWAIK